MSFSIGFCAQMLWEYKGKVKSAVSCNQVENEEEDQDLTYHILDKLCGEMCGAGNWKREIETGKNWAGKEKIAGNFVTDGDWSFRERK